MGPLVVCLSYTAMTGWFRGRTLLVFKNVIHGWFVNKRWSYRTMMGLPSILVGLRECWAIDTGKLQIWKAPNYDFVILSGTIRNNGLNIWHWKNLNSASFLILEHADSGRRTKASSHCGDPTESRRRHLLLPADRALVPAVPAYRHITSMNKMWAPRASEATTLFAAQSTPNQRHGFWNEEVGQAQVVLALWPPGSRARKPPRCWVRHGLAKAGRIMVQIEGANPPMSTETNCESFGMSGCNNSACRPLEAYTWANNHVWSFSASFQPRLLNTEDTAMAWAFQQSFQFGGLTMSANMDSDGKLTPGSIQKLYLA